MRRAAALLLAAWLACPPALAAEISTRTADGSGSGLAWTGLVSFDTLNLQCYGLNIANSVSPVENLQIQLGEGSGPTWETAFADYSWAAALYYNNGAASQNRDGATEEAGNSHAVGGIMTHHNLVVGGGETLGNLSFTLHRARSSTLQKPFVFQAYGYSADASSEIGTTGEGSYVADTNPITAVRVIAAQSDVLTSGTCTLYGSN
jgi:hypothetical protein